MRCVIEMNITHCYIPIHNNITHMQNVYKFMIRITSKHILFVYYILMMNMEHEL